jgi:hypothetical protein
LNLPALPAGRRYVTLGTDGFGRSDTRAVLRSFFQLDAQASLIEYWQSNKSLFSWWTHWNSARSSLQIKLMLTVSGNPEATGNQKKAKAVIPLWSLREYHQRE